MTGVVIAAGVIGGMGVLIGIFLGVFGEKFNVEVNEQELFVRSELPGNNCGACGYAGCDDLASAIAKGEADVNSCPVGGIEIAEKIGSIMGVTSEKGVRKVAFVKCAGNCDKVTEQFVYYGIEDCGAVEFMPNQGARACNHGCMGYGSCVKACPFDAIHIIDGIAVVDKKACKACGKCISACPKHIIGLVPDTADYMVQCNSKDKGKDVMKNCTIGCIGCKLCEKACSSGAVKVTDNLASIDAEVCTRCGNCAVKCPRGVIAKIS